jgi:hypothetical protein
MGAGRAHIDTRTAHADGRADSPRGEVQFHAWKELHTPPEPKPHSPCPDAPERRTKVVSKCSI